MTDRELFISEALVLFDETFEKVGGHYLDRGTSLLETLAEIDANTASTPLPSNDETIVAHVVHTAFYLRILCEYMRGERTEQANWSESWKRRTADAAGWREIISDLEAAYRETRELVRSFADEAMGEDQVGGAMVVVAHSAFHLGAIRQMIDALRASRTAKDEQEIRNLVSAWFAATKAGDVDTVLSLMTDDAVFLVPGRSPMTKKEFAETSRANAGKDAPKFDGTSEIREIVVAGNVAYMSQALRVVATMPGADAITRAGHTLTIFRKENGRWLLARDANLLARVDS